MPGDVTSAEGGDVWLPQMLELHLSRGHLPSHFTVKGRASVTFSTVALSELVVSSSR